MAEPKEATIARQRPSKHAPATTDTQGKPEETREAVFSMWYASMLYNEDQRDSRAAASVTTGNSQNRSASTGSQFD
jgi:hypothetical protein